MAEGLPRLVLATTNPGKLAELSALLAGVPYNLVSLSDAGIEQEVDEPGDTLEENASHKAATYARLGGLPTLADDSGLEVDALGGEPGPSLLQVRGTGGHRRGPHCFFAEQAGQYAREELDGALPLCDRPGSAGAAHGAFYGGVPGQDRQGTQGRQRLRLRPDFPPAPDRQDYGGADIVGEESDQPQEPGGSKGHGGTGAGSGRTQSILRESWREAW